MGKKSKVDTGASTSAVSNTTRMENIQIFIQKAEEYVDELDHEKALKFYLKALAINPTNSPLLDSVGEMWLFLGNPEKAINCFEQSIQIEPNSGYTKFMYMGQLSEGLQAIQYYSKGIQLLMDQYNLIMRGVKEGELDSVKKEICTAYIAIAEIYMTDSCDEENAESECQRVLEEAVKIDSQSPEVLQEFANFKISQTKNDEAVQLLQNSVNLWINEEENKRPSYEFRIDTTKLLIEVGQYQLAIDVGESLVEVDDHCVDVWYLLGMANKFLNHYSNACECLTTARKLVHKAKHLDPQLREQIDLLLVEVNEHIAKYGPDAVEEPEVEETSENPEDEKSIENTGEMDTTS